MSKDKIQYHQKDQAAAYEQAKANRHTLSELWAAGKDRQARELQEAQQGLYGRIRANKHVLSILWRRELGQ